MQTFYMSGLQDFKGVLADEKHLIEKNKPYYLLGVITAFSYMLFLIAYFFQDPFRHVMEVASYLTWHNLFEITGILVCFSSFVVSYHTYDQSKRLGSLALGNFLLVTGIIDAFHTFSYKGMPDFFIPNHDANRATTFWIISRLLSSTGFVAATFIPKEKSCSVKKHFFVSISVLLTVLCLIVVTYFPHLLPAMYVEGMGLTSIKIFAEYIAIALLSIAIVRYILEYRRTGDFLSIMLSGALIVSIFSELAFVSYANVYDIFNYLGHVYKFIAFFIIFKVIFIYNVQKPYLELSSAQKELKNYAENLDMIVDERTREIKIINQKLMEDLEYARDIQKSMLPVVFPEAREVAFSARYFPAEHVSGDFFNIFSLGDEHIGLCIGDVSGHGVSAAMLTVFVNQNIKAIVESDINNMEFTSPSNVLKNIYKSFNRTNFREEIYVVLLYAVYNLKTRELTYSSAGINVAPLKVENSGEVSEVNVKGFPICKFIEFHPADYNDSTIKLDYGDKILFYTDGLVENTNREGKSFSEDRLKVILSQNSHKSAEALSETVTRCFFEYTDINNLKDDITFFIMEVRDRDY